MDAIKVAQALNRRHFLQNSGSGHRCARAELARRHSHEGGRCCIDAWWQQRQSSPQPHFTPKAKRVIYLFQSGAPSQFETFDYKPKLQRPAGAGPAGVGSHGPAADDDDLGPDVVPDGAVDLSIPAAWRAGRVDFRSAATHGEDRRRPVHRALDVHRGDQSRSGRHVFPNRFAARRAAECRRLGGLWPGQLNQGLAGVRRDDFAGSDAQSRSTAVRPPVGQRLSADAIPGRETPQRQRSGAVSRQSGRLRSPDAARDARRPRGAQ